ncbi:hypothetical protein LSAT2_020984 [Lamellibrachia satsuma]|nr:hypothetical protein LSAT2_020984 [Lamellibrachia satsuma]
MDTNSHHQSDDAWIPTVITRAMIPEELRWTSGFIHNDTITSKHTYFNRNKAASLMLFQAITDLQVLLDAYTDWRLRDDPYCASCFGQLHESHRLQDDTEAAFRRRVKFASDLLSKARKIDRESFTKNDRLNLAILTDQLETFIDGYPFRVFGAYNPYSPWRTPFVKWKTVIWGFKVFSESDADRVYQTYRDIARQISQQMAMMNDSIHLGTANTADAMTGVVGVFDKEIEKLERAPTFSSFLHPFLVIPRHIANRTELRLAAEEKCREILLPAFNQMRQFLSTVYLKNTRPEVGLWSLPNGTAYYQACLRWHLSLNISAEDVHQLGLSEVKRVSDKIEKLIRPYRPDGDVHAYMAELRSEQENYYQTYDELIKSLQSIIAETHTKLPKLLRKVPKLPIVVKSFPKDNILTAGYTRPSWDGSKPGVFYVNPSSLNATPKFEFIPMILHEAEPGHHTQMAYVIESNVARFRKVITCRIQHAVPFSMPDYTAYSEPSRLQFPLSWALLAAIPHVSPAAFSSLCLGLSWPLYPMSAQQPSVPSVLGSPCRYTPCQPSSLQFPLSWALLAAIPHVSPAAFSSLCLGLSLPLYPMSAQQPSVPSVLGSPGRYTPCQPSSLQFPLSWALLAAIPHVSPAAFSSLCLGLSLPLYPMSAQQPSVPSVLGSPCRYTPCQPSSLQFPLSWALLAAIPHVSPAAFSSLCLGLFLPLYPMSAQQPSVPSVLGSSCRYTPCHPSSLQFPLSWALLAAIPHVSPAAFSSLCLGLSCPLYPMSARQPSVPSVLGSPCRYTSCQPGSLQFPLSWALLAAIHHVSPAAFSSLCLGLSLLLCSRSAQQPSVPSVLGSPCRWAPCQPNSLQFPLSWALLAAVPNGWGLYAESLGEEIDAYTEPNTLLGRYIAEIFRATRLVVDTGIHAFGWSRQTAIDYMMNHTTLNTDIIEKEVSRYIIVPGQACAYKIGEIKIRELRTKAENILGSRFDRRDFHEAVLGMGEVPLYLLDQTINQWIIGKLVSPVVSGGTRVLSLIPCVVIAIWLGDTARSPCRHHCLAGRESRVRTPPGPRVVTTVGLAAFSVPPSPRSTPSQGRTEDTSRTVIDMCEKVGVDVASNDISTSHRIPRRAKAIVCKFVRREVKSNIMKAKKKLKDASGPKIIIYDDLTSLRSKMLREVKKDSRVKRAFTRDGRLHYVVDVNGREKKVTLDNPDDLFNLGWLEAMISQTHLFMDTVSLNICVIH